jgi:hypothetical protein
VRNLLAAGMTLALVAVAACSPPRAGSSTGCVNAEAPHRAYVVVQHLSGASFQRCVGFTGPMIDGQTLMDQSGVQYEAHSLNSGRAVCQVDNEPKQFTQCFPQNQPYWALFVETRGAWTSSAGGFTDARLHDTEALGWHYVPSSDPSPGPPPLAQQLPAAGS